MTERRRIVIPRCDKLEVFRAESLQNEIRFYINPFQYLSATECKGGCILTLEERDPRKEEKQTNKKNKFIIFWYYFTVLVSIYWLKPCFKA